MAELLLVNPDDRPTKRRAPPRKWKKRHPGRAKSRPAWIRREEREEAAASRRAYGGKRRTKMARKRKWGSRKQRAALRKMLAARKRSIGGGKRRSAGRRRTKVARSRPRKRRFTAKARAAALRNLKHARRARRGTALAVRPKRRRGRRKLKRNPFGKSWSRKTSKRIAKVRRGRHRKGWQGMGLGHTKHKKRARPAKGGAVARKKARKARKSRKKGYRFTKARRAAAMRNIKAARRARRGKKAHRKARRSRKGRKARRRSRTRYSARTMRTIRSRRGRKGRRSRRRGISTLRRARRYLRGRRRVGTLARSYARKWGLRSNPNLSGGLAILKKAGFALGGLVATRYLPNLLAMIPGVSTALGASGQFIGVVGAVASGLAIWWLSGTKFMPGIVKGHRTEILIGAGLGVLEQVVAIVAPSLGGAPAAGLSDTWTEGTMPLSDYVADGSDLGGYVPELGLDVQQALAGYVQEGPISQAVAGLGLGSAAATAMVRSGRLGSGAAWTASGPIPSRPMHSLGASYGGIFTKPLF